MSWEEVVVYVIEAVVGIVVAVALPKLFGVLKSKTNSDIVQNLVAQAESTVSMCVTAVNQTFVDALKADGKFDKAAATSAFEQCKSKVLSILSDAAKEAIVATVGDFETWLEAQIESNVRLDKIDIGIEILEAGEGDG